MSTKGLFANWGAQMIGVDFPHRVSTEATSRLLETELNNGFAKVDSAV
jgi:hypothetical protein